MAKSTSNPFGMSDGDISKIVKSIKDAQPQIKRDSRSAVIAADILTSTYIQQLTSNLRRLNPFSPRLRRTQSRTLLARRRRCLRRRNPTSAPVSVKPLRSPLCAAWTTVKCLTCGSPHGGANTPRTMCSSCRSWRANTLKTMLEPSTSSEASIPNWLWPASTSTSRQLGDPAAGFRV